MLDKLFEKVATEFTLQYGLLGLLLIFMAYLVYYLTNKLLEGKDKQIDHLSDENKEYRERFTNLLDKQFKFGPKENID